MRIARSGVVVLAVAACAAVTGGVAGAQVGPTTSPPDAFAGGALLAVNDGYYAPEDALVALARGADGTFTGYATAYVRCGSSRRALSLSAPAAADGSLAASATVTRGKLSFAAGRVRATMTISGSVAPSLASGLLRVDGATLVRGGRRIACADTSVSWIAAPKVGPLTGRATALTGHASYFGASSGQTRTSPVAPVLVHSSADGRGFSHALWSVAIPCDDGATDDLTFSLHAERFTAGGAFTANKVTVDRAGGEVRRQNVSFGGHVTPEGLTGYLRVKVRDTVGAATRYTCDTTKLTWSATLVAPAGPVTPAPAAG